MADVNATRACVVCGATFPRKGKTLSCSDACKHARHLEIHKVGAIRSGRLKGPQQLQCKRCGVGFVGQATKVYCSKKCKDAERRETPAWAESVKRKRLKPRKSTAGIRRNKDRTKEYADSKAARAKRALAMLMSKPAQGDALRITRAICALSNERESLVRGRIAALVTWCGHADKKARKAAEPKPVRGQAKSTLDLKANPIAYIAAIGRWRAKTLKRKTGKTMIDDGTASAVAVSLMATKSCLYCACELTDESRTIDHMDPLSKGGTHSASNLCACCSSCNNKKGARGFMQFVDGLSDKHRRRAVAYYERLNKFVQQGSLSFGMAA